MRYSKDYCFDTDNVWGYLLQPHTFQNLQSFKGKNNLCCCGKWINLFFQWSLPAFDSFVFIHRPGSLSKRCAPCQRISAWAGSVRSTLLTDSLVCGCDCVCMFARWPCTSLSGYYTVPMCVMYCSEKSYLLAVNCIRNMHQEFVLIFGEEAESSPEFQSRL